MMVCLTVPFFVTFDAEVIVRIERERRLATTGLVDALSQCDTGRDAVIFHLFDRYSLVTLYVGSNGLRRLRLCLSH